MSGEQRCGLPRKHTAVVARVDNMVVQLDEAPWPFVTQNSEKISAFWRGKQKNHPHFYDGQVHVMTSRSPRRSNSCCDLVEMCSVLVSLSLYTGGASIRVHRQKSISPEERLSYAETEPC